MTETGKILLEAICGISVLFALLYIVLMVKKRMATNPMPFSSILIDRRAVTVTYAGTEMIMWLYFYTEGVVFEKENGKKMCIPLNNIISLRGEEKDDSFFYYLEFDPEISEKDTIEVISVDDLSELFAKILPQDKIISDKNEKN